MPSKKRERDKKAFVDRVQALSPIFCIRTKGMDITYHLKSGTKVRALSYDPLNHNDILLLLAIIAFCQRNGEEGIPVDLYEKMNLKWEFEETGMTIISSWRELASICGYVWKGQIKSQLKESLKRLWGIGFQTTNVNGDESAWHLLSYDTKGDRVRISVNPRLALALNLFNPETYKFVAYNLDIMNQLNKIAFMLAFYLTSRIDEGTNREILIDTIKNNIWNEQATSSEIDRKRTQFIRNACLDLNETGLWSIKEKNKGKLSITHKKGKKTNGGD